MIINIADRIRFAREQHGMTQTDLAKKLGISRSAVNLWEMSMSSPSLANIIEMTKIFGVSADYLLGISNDMVIDVSDLKNDQKEVLFRLLDCFKESNSQK